jgi:ribosomal protein S12 methylthiotransferase
MARWSKTGRGPERFFIVSLGCAKNTVDAQGMAVLLERAGYEPVEEPCQADLLIVNTCGFIEPARQESLDVMRGLAAEKRADQRLLIAGCWSQRDPEAILKLVPGADGVIGTRCWMDVTHVARQLSRAEPHGPVIHVAAVDSLDRDGQDVLRVAIQGSSAYLKIADGCSRACAFCAIPLIKGPAVSRPMERILDDAATLAGWGIKEIVLIAQDTTAYGRDRGMRDGLATLLERMVARVPEVPWIRVMYAFPGAVTPRLVDVMAREPQVLPYLDIPLQHAHPSVLRRMARPANVRWVHDTVAMMRDRVPEIAVRTTFVVGYPGETEEEFEALVDFVERVKFDRVGVFPYSHEEGTPAASLPDDVPEDVKAARRDHLMAVQQPISLARNQALVGSVLDVLIEGQGDDLSVGRSYRDAPEVDGLVLVEGEMPVGHMVPVEITSALEYDLVGRLAPGR